jgi:hypothetical protein
LTSLREAPDGNGCPSARRCMNPKTALLASLLANRGIKGSPCICAEIDHAAGGSKI